MALKDFLKDEAKNNASKSNNGRQFERVSVTSDHSMIDQVDTGGSVLVGEAEELAQEPQTAETEDGEEVVELGKFENDEALDTSEMPSQIPIDSASMERSALFTEAEKNTLEELEKNERISEEEQSAIDRVESALESPEYPNSRTELYYQLWNEEHGEEPKSKEQKVRELGRNRDWIQSPKDEIREKSLEEASLGELADLIDGEGTSEAELQQNPEPEIQEESEELCVPEVDQAEEAARAWKARAKKTGKSYWEEMAEDLAQSDEKTHYETISKDSRRVTTQDPELRDALLNSENEPFDGTVKVEEHDKKSGTVVATVSKGEHQ